MCNGFSARTEYCSELAIAIWSKVIYLPTFEDETLISRLPLWASMFDILLFSMDYNIATASDSYI